MNPHVVTSSRREDILPPSLAVIGRSRVQFCHLAMTTENAVVLLQGMANVGDEGDFLAKIGCGMATGWNDGDTADADANKVGFKLTWTSLQAAHL